MIQKDITMNMRSYVLLLLSMIYSSYSAGFPVTILKNPANSVINEGSTAQFNCAVNASVPYTVAWLKNGSSFTETLENRSVILLNNTLRINDVSRRDAGTYSCLLKYTFNGEEKSLRSYSANLTVCYLTVGSPKWQNFTSYIPWRLPFVARCTVHGLPQPTVTWFRDSSVISNDTKHRLKVVEEGYGYRVEQLTIINVATEDNGLYFCEVKNSVSRIRHFVRKLTYTETCGDDRLWKCPLKVKCIARSGLCDGFNDCGDLTDETANCSLPSRVWGLRTEIVLPHAIKVTWYSSYIPVLNYTIAMTVNGSTSLTTFPAKFIVGRTFTNLTTGFNYTFAVYGVNHMGAGKQSIAKVYLPTIDPPGPAYNVTVESFFLYSSNAQVTLHWNRPKFIGEANPKWLRYEVQYCRMDGSVPRNASFGKPECFTIDQKYSPSTTASIFSLKFKSRYSFRVTSRIEKDDVYYVVGQQSDPIFYTIPSKHYGHQSNSIGTGAKVGIGMAVLVVVGGSVAVLAMFFIKRNRASHQMSYTKHSM